MIKYQKGTIYQIKIPDDFDFQSVSDDDVIKGRKFWEGRLFKMTIHGSLGTTTTRGSVVNGSGNVIKGYESLTMWKAWLTECVYISPFDGQVK